MVSTFQQTFLSFFLFFFPPLHACIQKIPLEFWLEFYEILYDIKLEVRNSLQCFFDNSTRERRHFCSSFFYYFVVGRNIPQSFSPPTHPLLLSHTFFLPFPGKNNCVVWIWINNNILCDFTPATCLLIHINCAVATNVQFHKTTA